jgi:ERCC4-type nuclease
MGNSYGPLIIDRREQKRKFLIDCFKRWNVPYFEATLELGDYVVPFETGVVIIERKSYADFLGSLNELPARLSRMRDNYGIAVLLLEGRVEFDPQSGTILRRVATEERPNQGRVATVATRYSLGMVNNFLFSLQTKGILFARTESLTHSALWLRDLYEYAGKEVHEPLGRSIDMNTTQGRLRGMMSFLPGVGEVLASRLHTTFPTMTRLMAATVEELSAVDGIGLKRATAVWGFLHQ